MIFFTPRTGHADAENIRSGPPENDLRLVSRLATFSAFPHRNKTSQLLWLYNQTARIQLTSEASLLAKRKAGELK